MNETPRILYCHCAFAQVIPRDVKQKVLERLAESGTDFECVPDLCEMSARRVPLLEQLARGQNVRIAACYERAVHGLFRAAGHPLPQPGPEIVNMRVQSADDAARALLRPVEAPPAIGQNGSADSSTNGE